MCIVVRNIIQQMSTSVWLPCKEHVGAFYVARAWAVGSKWVIAVGMMFVTSTFHLLSILCSQKVSCVGKWLL